MNQEYTRAPHMPAAVPQNNAALLIDFDNVTMGIRSNLGQELRNLLESDVIRGKVAVQRAYADWRRYPQYIVSLSEASIDLIFAPAYGSSKKNATDIRLAIDALELVFTRPEISTFILLSGDSDFSSLVLKLKEYGKYVIGVGLQESSSDILVQNCDEYYSYNRLSGFTSADDLQTQKHDPWDLAKLAAERMAERGDVMRSDRLKQVMLEIDPSFDEKAAGFSKFNRFLGEAAQRELIRLHKRENGQFDVAPVGGGASTPTASPPPRRDEDSSSKSSRSRRGRRGGRGRGGSGSDPAPTPAPTSSPEARPATAATEGPPSEGLQAAYDELAAVVQELSRGGSPVRDSMAKRKLLARDASFDEGVLGFSKFSFFLRQAHADGVVSMNQREDGNYYLTPGSGTPPGPSRTSSAPSTPDSGGAGADLGSKVVGLDRKEGVLARTLSRFRRSGEAKPAEAAGNAAPPAESPAPSKQPPRPEAEAPKARTKPTPQPTESSERTSPPRSRGGRGRGRGRGGSGTSDRPKGQSDPAAASSTPEPDEKREPRARPEARSQAESRPTPKSRPKPEARSQAESRPRPEARSQAERKPRPEARSQAQSAPKPESRPEAASQQTPEPTPSAPSKPETPAGPEAPRRMGRTRSGRARPSRKPSGESTQSRIGPIPDDELPAKPAASKAPPPSSKPSQESVANASSNGPSADPVAAPVSHMIRNYAGVGKRTAEVLYERFGEDVFDVIDREPSRVTDVLSEGRAKVVIEARRAERES